jgi:hypothetical protein
MSKIPEEVIADWAKHKKHIRDRINRINKRLKKYEKQKKHFELRLKLVKEYEAKMHVGNSGSNGTQEESR